MVLQVKVIPRAQRSEVIGPMADGTLKVKIAAVPEDGKANEELCRTLAAHYKVRRSSVEVISGQTNTRKMVRLPDTPESITPEPSPPAVSTSSPAPDPSATAA